MAFSTPRTWTSGELVTDTILNAHIKDQFDALSSHAHSGSAGDGSSALAEVKVTVSEVTVKPVDVILVNPDNEVIYSSRVPS